MPNLSSSPWIRGAPLSGLALLICRIRLTAARSSSANAKTRQSLTVPLDHRCGLDQHHRLQTARPQSVEPDPERAVDRTAGADPAAGGEERAAGDGARG